MKLEERIELNDLRAEVASLKEQNALLTVQVPAGWVMVPSMPTDAQLDRAVSFALNVQIGGAYTWSMYMRDVYLRMLAAAPITSQVKSDDTKDADRYRWLRRRDIDTIDHGGLFVGKTPENIVINDMDLDSAIDAAISAQEEKGRGL